MKQEALIKELMSIPGKVISLHDGAYLYREGAPAHYFYIVRSGHIFVVKYGASGRVLALRSTPSSSPYWRHISKSIRTSLSRC